MRIQIRYLHGKHNVREENLDTAWHRRRPLGRVDLCHRLDQETQYTGGIASTNKKKHALTPAPHLATMWNRLQRTTACRPTKIRRILHSTAPAQATQPVPPRRTNRWDTCTKINSTKRNVNVLAFRVCVFSKTQTRCMDRSHACPRSEIDTPYRQQ